MYVIQAHSVNDALAAGVRYILAYGDHADSRNGPVLISPVPVTTMTTRPRWRVLSIPGRNENPFFHFIESLWMLAGRRDLAPLTEIVSRMRTFSDDNGETQPGAYGYRWRRHFHFDQLDWAVQRLKSDANDRRVVISMWDGIKDPIAADKSSKDVPCNTHLYLGIQGEKLNMTVVCRSNDLLWGAHGANAVHFSVLQEYLAARIGCFIGRMWQVSNNYHMYENTIVEELIKNCEKYDEEEMCAYRSMAVGPYPLFDTDVNPDLWDEDLIMWWKEPAKVGLRHSFFRRVATPIFLAHKAYKKKDFETAKEVISRCQAEDWKLACTTWLEKRTK